MSLELLNVNGNGSFTLINVNNSGYFSLAFSGSEVPTTTTTTSTTSTTTTTPTTTTSTTTTTTTAAPTTTTTTTSTTTTTTTAAGGIVTDNLFMKLDASNYTSGLWSDETGNGNNASISGAAWLSDNGGIFDFDGINDTISIPHTASLSLSTTSQRTIQVWVKFDTFPTSTDRAIVFSKLSGAYTFDGYFGGPNLNGEIVVATNGNVAKTSVSALTISLNTWYLFTFISQITSTANTTKAYINETEYITDANGGNTYSESNPLTLGYMPAPLTGLGAIAYLNGKIGACYFYTKGLSAAEVSTNYNATKARYETPTTTTTTSTTTTTTTATPTTTTTTTTTTSTTTTTTTVNPTTTTSTTTTTTTAASGDLIRAALQPSFTASYDAAAIGSFINVNSASYNSVFANLSNATRYGQTNAVLTGSIGGGSSWGAPFAFAFTASVIPSGNYIVGYATVIASAGASQSLAIYYSTASNATASTAIGDRIAPANSFISSGSNSVYYFIRKAPTDTLPANSVMYLWSTGSLTIKGPNIARIPYKLVNGPAPLQITGSWSSWNTATTGQPGHQFIVTSQLQW